MIFSRLCSKLLVLLPFIVADEISNYLAVRKHYDFQ